MPARVTALAALVAVTLLAGGCAPVASPTVDEAGSVSVDVIQGRTDRDGRVIVMDVTNTGDAAIDLEHARLDTEQFSGPAEWSRGTTLEPGRTVSLRAPLADAVCPAPDGAEPTVTVRYLDPDGQERTVTVEPTQSTDVLSIIERDDCMGVLAAERAEIRVADSVDWAPGAHQPVALGIIGTPTGDGSLEIVEARSTILLQIVDDAGARVAALPLGLVLNADSAATEFTLHLVPTRCDPHAIAEDKRGTIMIIGVRLDDGTEGVVYVRSGDAVKASLLDFVTDYCAAGG